MVAAAGKSKTEIRDLVLAAAKEQIAKFDSMDVDEYKATKFDIVSRQGTYENVPCIVTKGTLAGMTLEAHKEFRENMKENLKRLNPKVTMEKLEEADGIKILHQHVEMPFMVTNRSFIVAAHIMENDDGSLESLMTTTGNEDMQEKYKSKIGGDVVAITHFNYTKLTPCDGGCTVEMVVS